MTGQHGPGASLCTGGSCQETFEAAASWPAASLWPQDEAGLDQANYSPQPNLAHHLCQPPGAALPEYTTWGLNSLLSLSSGGQRPGLSPALVWAACPCVPWFADTALQPLSPSMSGLLLCAFSYRRTTHPSPVGLILNGLHQQRLYFQIDSHSQIPG